MKIQLNNKEEEFDANQMTMSELLDVKKYTFRLLVTKINGKLIRKEDRAEAIIRDGDDVVVLHMISGG
jgi:thiamine biosynthesis protein ThiS